MKKIHDASYYTMYIKVELTFPVCTKASVYVIKLRIPQKIPIFFVRNSLLLSEFEKGYYMLKELFDNDSGLVSESYLKV